MKKILIIALSFGLILPAVAQIAKTAPKTQQKEVRKAPRITPEQYANRHVELLDKKVKLTPAQRTKAIEIYKRNASQRIGAIGHDAKTLNTVAKTEREDINKILTADQKLQLQKMDEKNRMQERKIQQERELKVRTVDPQGTPRKNLKEDLKPSVK